MEPIIPRRRRNISPRSSRSIILPFDRVFTTRRGALRAPSREHSHVKFKVYRWEEGEMEVVIRVPALLVDVRAKRARGSLVPREGPLVRHAHHVQRQQHWLHHHVRYSLWARPR